MSHSDANGEWPYLPFVHETQEALERVSTAGRNQPNDSTNEVVRAIPTGIDTKQSWRLGALNVVTGLGEEAGAALTSHPDIAKVAFTGSTATGKKVMASVAGTVKRLTLELGGNDPAIVLDDVNVKDVAARIFQGAMVNSGQVCLAKHCHPALSARRCVKSS